MARNLSVNRYFQAMAARHAPRHRFAGSSRQDWRTWRDQLLPAVKATLGRMPVKAPLKVGTRVATVGRSPDPTALTLTRGVVSAAGRIGETAVQIDAKTNYGNAGGPIVNIDGLVVGLVTHIKPDATWSQNSGVGFATTAEAIQKVLADLRAGKNIAKPKRGYLGIRMSSGSEAVKGVKIESVQPKSAAADAELKKNDVITHVNGKAVAEASDLAKIILKMKPGEKIVLTILRGKEVLKKDVVLGEHPFL